MLVLKECLDQPMTEQENAELEELEQVRDKKLMQELERMNPGWRQREIDKFEALQQVAQLLEDYAEPSTASLLRTSNRLIQVLSHPEREI